MKALLEFICTTLIDGVLATAAFRGMAARRP
jgi:hypothetical protein